jgi:hypothetical protein
MRTSLAIAAQGRMTQIATSHISTRFIALLAGDIVVPRATARYLPICRDARNMLAVNLMPRISRAIGSPFERDNISSSSESHSP